MKRELIAALLAMTPALTGCSDDPGATGAPRLPTTQKPTTQKPTTQKPTTQKTRPIPAGRRVALPRATPDQAIDAIRIDLTDALGARTVDEAPVGAGMLLAQLNLFSTDPDYEVIRPGQPYLMTRGGQWRQFDLARYGFGATANGELSMAISSDGRRVALAAPSGLVTVDLRDNTFRRFDLPVRHAIGLEWSVDTSTLFLKDRDSDRPPCGSKGCAMDVSTGSLTDVPYNLSYSAPGDADVVFELQAATKNSPGQVVSHRDGVAPTAVALQYLTTVSTAGGPAARTLVAYAQCERRPGVRNAGVVVVDPTSGRVVSMLEDTRRPACRLGARTWVDDRRLLVDDYLSGAIWLWDVERRRVGLVAASQTSGVNYSLARDVVDARLGVPRRP